LSLPAWLGDDNGVGPQEQALLDQLPPSRRLRTLLKDLDVLAASEGFLHLNMGQIASRLRCSKASLYRLAPGLEELFELVIKLRFARVFDAGERQCADAVTWTDKLVAHLDSLVTEQSKLSYEYMRDLYAFSRTASLMKSYEARGEGELRRLLQGGIDAGEFQRVNPGLAAQMLRTTISRICQPDFYATTGLPTTEGLPEALRIFGLGIFRRTQSQERRKTRTKPA
jgi:AcrR family transcriptional regulator